MNRVCQAFLATSVVLVSASAGGQTYLETFSTNAGAGGAGFGYGSAVGLDGGLAAISMYDQVTPAGKVAIVDVDQHAEIARLSLGFDFNTDQLIYEQGTLIVSDASASVMGTSSGVVKMFNIQDVQAPQLVHTFTHDDPAFSDDFGYAMGFDGENVYIGSVGDTDIDDGAGAVFVFDALTGNQVLKLTPADGADGDLFGSSIEVAGDTLAVGALSHGAGGAVYFFDTNTGNQIDKVIPANLPANANFGRSLAVAGDTLLVGANRDGAQGLGKVYVYDITNRQLVTTLEPTDCADGFCAGFGFKVAIDGDLALVSTRVGQGLNFDGTVFVYDTSSWDVVAELEPSDYQPSIGNSDQFGSSIAIENDMVVVGAAGVQPATSQVRGVVYYYDLSFDCAADVNGDGMLSPTDFSAWLIAYNNGDPGCDQNDDGACTPTDFTAWVTNFNAGC